MAQIQSSYNNIRSDFGNMTFSPDIPASILKPNEYNDGINIETDVRGIRSVTGEEEILSTIPGTPTYVTSGFRQNNEFWFIVATTEGRWYARSSTVDWYDITPGNIPIIGYNQATNITDAWNGTVVFFNDTIGPPMFLPDEPNARLIQYSNTITPASIQNISYLNPTTQRITIQSPTPYTTSPYLPGQKILISDVNTFFNGVFTVVASTTTTIDYLAVPGASYPPDTIGTVSPEYTWNYNPNWRGVVANFMRLYSTPNVGSILVAGNLRATTTTNTTELYPVTVQWSQAFGLNQAPQTWQPTVSNVANQLEVPLRGPALDAFPCNGQFFLCSYWDTVVFAPINYSTTSAPILGVRLYNQGRGLLSSNCWGNTDKLVYGIDARDIWAFDGNDFVGIGNQRVKNWFYDELDPRYYDRVFMEVNTHRSQIEIYYPDSSAVNGVPNKMLSYRWDIDCWNAPREVQSATFACESPIYRGTNPNETPDLGSRTVVYARGVLNSKLVQKDVGYKFINTTQNPNGNITSRFRRNNIQLLRDYSKRLMVHRVLPEVINMNSDDLPKPVNDPNNQGNVSVTIQTSNSVGSSVLESNTVVLPINTQNPWVQINQNVGRVNNIELSNTSNNSIWMCTATTWQVTPVEDDR